MLDITNELHSEVKWKATDCLTYSSDKIKQGQATLTNKITNHPWS